MPTPPPSYLKILRPENVGREDVATTTKTQLSDTGVWKDSHESEKIVASFWKAYSDATGLRIDPGTPAASTDSAYKFEVSALGAKSLANAANQLADQLQRQQQLLTSQQAELAARAAVIVSSHTRHDLANQIERVLSDATLATGTDAAAVYMLDDETEQLTTRFVFGMSPVQRLATSRPLRGARADLEAMVQGIVAIDNLRAGSMDLYRCPEQVASGICVCLGDVELPVGTMWLFGHEIQTYDEFRTAAARLAGNNIVQAITAVGNPTVRPTNPLSVAVPAALDDVELEQPNPADFEIEAARLEDVEIVQTPVQSQTFNDSADTSPTLPVESERHLTEFDEVRIGKCSGNVAPSPRAIETPTLTQWTRQVSEWQHETLPLGEKLAPDWSIDGMIESPLAIARSWHHWDVLPDGVMSMSICQNEGGQEANVDMAGVLDSTIARAALQSHASYRHRPGDAVMRVLDTLLQVRDGAIDEEGQPKLSLLYAHVDPETGHAEIASVGDWSTLVISKYGFRPVGMGNAGVIQEDAFLGRQSAVIQDTMLLPGEVLLVTGRDWMGTKPNDSMSPSQRAQSAQNRIGSAIQKALRETERSPLAAVRRLLASSPLTGERTAIALQRAESKNGRVSSH